MAYTTIDDPTIYFNTKLYTGTGSTHNITGVGFQPDWVWIKHRNEANPHKIFDAVRGVGKSLKSNSSDAEATNEENGYVSAFGSDGFTVVGGSTSSNDVNKSSGTYVSWNWLGANGTASNTDGSITSTVSANTTAGFSIVSYTGTGSNATVGHGLGVAPKWYITKNRDTADNWLVYHESIGNTKGAFLNLNNNPGTSSAYWNDTSPTSTVFSVGTEVPMNKSGDNIIAYCFAEKKGYSKFGSYTGGGSSFPFIYTGFKPAWLLVKQTTGASQNWYLWDNKRDSFNLADTPLKPDESLAESGIGAYNIDMLSNGFKFRGTEIQINASGETYIYMAFAENPFVTSTGIPTTAR